MAMRYRGGGVGHASTRAATDKFYADRPRNDHNQNQDAEATARLAEVEKNNCGSPESDDDSDGSDGMDENEDIFLEDSEDDQSDEEDSGDEELEGGDPGEEDYGYASPAESEEEDGNDDEVVENGLAEDCLGPEDGEDETGEEQALGFANY